MKLEDLNRESSFLYLDYEKYSKKENEEGKKKDFYVWFIRKKMKCIDNLYIFEFFIVLKNIIKILC